MWSFVGKRKANAGTHAIDHHTDQVLACLWPPHRRDSAQSAAGALRTHPVYTSLGAYERHLDPDMHSPSKQNTQKIERKHLTLRTRIKRLVWKTICFSKSIQMHDIVIGLFVNRYAFGLLV